MTEQDTVDPKLIAAEKARQKLREFVGEKPTEELLTTAYQTLLAMEEWKLKTEDGKDFVLGDEPKIKFLLEAVRQVRERVTEKPKLEAI